jgi:hypothetical protein
MQIGEKSVRVAFVTLSAVVNSRAGFLSFLTFFLTTGFFFTAAFFLGLAFGFAFAPEAAAFFVPVFAPVFLTAPAVVFLAADLVTAAAVAANERRGVPVRNVRRVKDGSGIGVVVTLARATPRTADDVPRRKEIRWVSNVNIVLSGRKCGQRNEKYFDDG